MQIFHNTTKEQNNSMEIYIYGEFKRFNPNRYRQYSFKLLNKCKWIEKEKLTELWDKVSSEIIAALYDNTVVTFTFEYSVYDSNRKIAYNRHFDIQYRKYGAIEILAHYLLREKDDEIIWIRYKDDLEPEKIVLLQNCIDNPITDRIFKIYEYGRDGGRIVVGKRTVKFFADTEIEYGETKYKTAKNYDKNKDYVVEIDNEVSWRGFNITVDNNYITFDKLMERIVPVFEKYGFVFANMVDPFPPDCEDMTEQEAEIEIEKWKSARKELNVSNPQTKIDFENREKQREMQELRRQKARKENEKIRQEIKEFKALPLDEKKEKLLQANAEKHGGNVNLLYKLWLDIKFWFERFNHY